MASNFWKHVSNLDDSTDTCWIWVGAMYDDGRGKFWDSRRRRLVKAHRAAWELRHGLPIPEGHRLKQRCNQPNCVRHWELDGMARKLTPKDRSFIARSLLGSKRLAERYGITCRHVQRIRNWSGVARQTSHGDTFA